MPGQPFIRPAPLILLALAMSGCFVLGCIGQQPPETANATVNNTGPGFQPVPAGENAFIPPVFRLNDTIASITETGGGNPPVQILYIRGSNLNGAGEASLWTIAIRSDNRTSIVTVGSDGRNNVPLKSETRWREINLTDIVPPEQIFDLNREAIFPQTGNGTVRDLVISEGIYTLTPAAPGSGKVLTFNATTGEQLK